MDNKVKTFILQTKIKLVVGWLFLIPIWIVVEGSIGVVDKTTGWVVNEWILLVPSSITLMMLGFTVWFLKVKRQVK